jgi:hypothetical protein
MTNPHPQARPCHHTTAATGDEIDVVPGTPLVPITVWRTPSDEPGPHLGPRLAARLLAAYTHTGDTIYDRAMIRTCGWPRCGELKGAPSRG